MRARKLGDPQHGRIYPSHLIIKLRLNYKNTGAFLKKPAASYVGCERVTARIFRCAPSPMLHGVRAAAIERYLLLAAPLRI